MIHLIKDLSAEAAKTEEAAGIEENPIFSAFEKFFQTFHEHMLVNILLHLLKLSSVE